MVEAEIVRVAPFGDFSRRYRFHRKRWRSGRHAILLHEKLKAQLTHFPDEVIYVGRDYDLDYCLAINEEPKSYPEMIEMRIDRPVGQLARHFGFVKESLHQIEAELKGYAGHLNFFIGVYRTPQRF